MEQGNIGIFISVCILVGISSAFITKIRLRFHVKSCAFLVFDMLLQYITIQYILWSMQINLLGFCCGHIIVLIRFMWSVCPYLSPALGQLYDCPKHQWSNPEGYGKDHLIPNHNTKQQMSNLCIILGMYSTYQGKFQWRGTSNCIHGICVMQLLVPALGTCFWMDTSPLMWYILLSPLHVQQVD